MQVKTSLLEYIPITLLKSFSDILGNLLSKLANLSIAEGVFPDQFKLGQVTPIPKKKGHVVDDPITNIKSFSPSVRC